MAVVRWMLAVPFALAAIGFYLVGLLVGFLLVACLGAATTIRPKLS